MAGADRFLEPPSAAARLFARAHRVIPHDDIEHACAPVSTGRDPIAKSEGAYHGSCAPVQGSFGSGRGHGGAPDEPASRVRELP